MALVAYGASDDSDLSEDEDSGQHENNVPPINISDTLNNDAPKNIPHSINTDVQIEAPKRTSLFASIPQPKYTVNAPITEEDSDIIVTGNANPVVSSEPPKTSSLFTNLPVPKKVNLPEVEEEDDEFLKKSVSSVNNVKSLMDVKSEPKPKERKPVRIILPSLSEVTRDNEDLPQKAKKITPQYRKSGLFELLPPPKKAETKVTNRPLIPQALANKQKASAAAKSKEAAKRKPLPRASSTKTSLTIDDPDDDDDMEESSGFFNLTSSVEKKDEKPTVSFFNLDAQFNTATNVTDSVPAMNISQPSSSYSESNITSNYSNIHNDTSSYEQWDAPNKNVDMQINYNDTNYAEESYGDAESHSNVQLSNEELLRLKGKRKRSKEDELVFIDVKQDDHLADREEWMLKALTEEKPTQSHSRNKGNMPTSQQRRKHQITYLAFQAKEREQDLKKQWAQNYQTKKQTQSKYGF